MPHRLGQDGQREVVELRDDR
eukprot:SAG22_NODE_13579_length_401_cov_1.192053_2_plen_20_part_01